MLTTPQMHELRGKLGIDEYSLWREYVQILFLQYWGHRPRPDSMALKGGTAIRLLLNGFRFSEDLDFSTALPASRVELEVREAVTAMRVELPELALDHLRASRSSWLARLAFPRPGTRHPVTVSLNCSLRERPVAPDRTVLATPFPVVPYPLVAHLPWREILAEKVRALLMRGRGRDVFDVWFLLTRDVPLDLPVIARKLKAVGRPFDPSRLSEALAGISPKILHDDLDKFLPSTHRRMIPDLPRLLAERWRAAAPRP